MKNPNKIHIDIPLVQRLISSQFPQWAHLKIKPVEPDGWDNKTFRLGEHMLVRLPSAIEYADQVEKEQCWLPKLAPFLPLAIPKPLALGKPTDEYPFPWSIYEWINGETATLNNVANMNEFAITLAQFLHTLHTIDTSGGPQAGPHNFYRGGLLKTYDTETQQAIIKLHNKIDTDVVTQIWNDALASTWNKPPVWIHGDIAPNNLLVKNGKLCGVIDFGGLGIGDPACDYAITWTFFNKENRQTFRTTLAIDNDTWNRARGWALWKVLITYAQLPGTNVAEKENSRQVISEILADYELKKNYTNNIQK